MCTTNFWNSNIFAALVGGFIGFFSSIVTSVWYTNYKERKTKHTGFIAWSIGMQAEMNHLLKVINEISDCLTSLGMPSTKRLNYDYIQQARISVINYVDDIILIENLTNAYRDIDHTNAMLDRLENMPIIIGNVQASLLGVKTSILTLQKSIDERQKTIKKPTIFK